MLHLEFKVGIFFSFFSTSEIFSIVLCMGSSKKYDALIFVSTCIICAFFLWLFKIFSLSLVLSNLMMVQFSHVSCVWDSLNFLHLWVYRVHQFRKFAVITLKIFCLSPLIYNYLYISHFNLSHSTWMLLFGGALINKTVNILI